MMMHTIRMHTVMAHTIRTPGNDAVTPGPKGFRPWETQKQEDESMALEEKVGQLLCPLGWEMYEIKDDEVHPSEKFKRLM